MILPIAAGCGSIAARLSEISFPLPAPRASLKLVGSLADIPPVQWDALAGAQPFLRHAFLRALEATGCVGAQTGWTPCHLTLWRDGTLAGATPLYEKSHSFGEYVFDWAWAEAYHRSGLRYYPKLVAAIPFSPIPSSRLLAADDEARAGLLDGALELARQADLSSLHVLFPPPDEAALMESRGMLLRHGVQFHWCNEGYRHFDDFLATLTRDKRKKLRQERRRVAEAGIRFRHLTGRDIDAAHWRFFERCYRRTYALHRSTPYLNLEFFLRIGAALPEHLLLVVAERDGAPVAAALDVFTDSVLYGRYWGALEYIPGLHFETCYHQAIEFCIARGIASFEGGAQGEHKLARGLLPVRTVSAHWLAHPQFSQAIERYLARESVGVDNYIDELNEHSPLKRNG
jgi:hypothetical protein